MKSVGRERVRRRQAVDRHSPMRFASTKDLRASSPESGDLVESVETCDALSAFGAFNNQNAPLLVVELTKTYPFWQVSVPVPASMTREKSYRLPPRKACATLAARDAPVEAGY